MQKCNAFDHFRVQKKATWWHWWHGDIYYLDCFYLFCTKKFLLNDKFCKKYDHFDVKVSKESDKILKYSQDQKSIKTPFFTQILNLYFQKWMDAKLIQEICPKVMKHTA